MSRQGLAPALPFTDTWAAGSTKTALILEAENKNIVRQKGTDTLNSYSNLKGEKTHDVSGFQSKPHKCDPPASAKQKSQLHYPGTQGKPNRVKLLGLMPELLEKQLHLGDIR